MSVKRGLGSHDSHESHSSTSSEHLNKILIENFAKLQKIMVENAEKMDLLNNQLTKLLQIFEVSAKSFAERNFRPQGGDLQKEAEFVSKLNTLLDQNKTIAKGLALLGEDMKEKIYGEGAKPSSQPSMPAPSRPRFERIEIPALRPFPEPRRESEDSDSDSIERKLPKI